MQNQHADPHAQASQIAFSDDVLDHFDQVCRNLQDPHRHKEAAQTFEQIFQRPDVISLAQAAIHRRLVGANSNPDDPVILHALSLIRRTKRKDSSIMNYLIQGIEHSKENSEVKRAFLRTCAEVYWGYLLKDGGEFLRQTCTTARNGSTEKSQEAGELLYQMMVASFNAEAADRELLNKSNHVFITSELPVLVFDTAFAMVTKSVQQNDFPSSLKVTSLLNAVLNLFQDDFTRDDGVKGRRTPSIRLNKHWDRERKFFPRLLEILFSIYGTISESNVADPSYSRHTVYGCIEFFGCLHSDGFTDNLYGQMITTLVDGINNLQWDKAVSLDESYSYASVWEGISRACGLEDCFVILGEERMKLFVAGSIRIIKLGIAVPLDAENACHAEECRQLILETWAKFCTERHRGDSYSHYLKSFAKEIVFAFLERLLHIDKDLGDNANFESREYRDDLEDTSIEDASFQSAAKVIRIVSNDVAGPIFGELTKISQEVLRIAKGKHPPTNLYDFLEQICGLVKLSGCSLADDFVGQTTTIPEVLVHSFQTNGAPNSGAHSVVQILLQGLLSAAEIDLTIIGAKSPHCDEASPRVAACIADALSTVSTTYLVNKNQADLAEAMVGGLDFAFRARGISMQYGVNNILKRGFEPEVAKASSKLLVALSEASNNPRYTPLDSSIGWQELLNMDIAILVSLPLISIRNISLSLAKTCGDDVVPKMLMPAVVLLNTACQPKQAAADGAERTIAALNVLWGAGLVPKNVQIHSFLAETVRNDSGIIPRIHSHFADTRPEVGHVILETVTAFAKSILFANITSKVRSIFVQSCLQLICAHCETIRRRGSNEEETTVEDITIMLGLCELLVSHEIEAEAAFKTMDCISRIMSHNMVLYPRVLEAYIQLTTSLIRMYAPILSSIPESLKDHILKSLKIALNSYSAELQSKGLEALSIFVEHTSSDSSSMLDHSMREFLHLILDGLVRNAFQLYSASLALLAIVHFNKERSWVESAGQELINKQPSFGPLLAKIVPAATAASKKGALKGMTTPGNPNMRRNARSEFAEHVRQVVIECSQL